MDPGANGTPALGLMSSNDQHGLDELCLDNILAYVRDAPARGTCKKWAQHIFHSCNLEGTIRLKELLQVKGSLAFDCFATRELGPDIMETASFHFDFFADGNFDLQWYHSYSGDWDTGCQELRGKWLSQDKTFACEIMQESYENEQLEENLTCDPPAVISFHVPQDTVLAERVMYDDDSTPFPWSLCKMIMSRGQVSDEPEKLKKYSELPLPLPTSEHDPDAQYVDVDGESVLVCTDIVANYPAESWAQLMRLRLQFGTA